MLIFEHETESRSKSRNAAAFRQDCGQPRTGVPEQREAGFMDPLIYSPANAARVMLVSVVP